MTTRSILWLALISAYGLCLAGCDRQNSAKPEKGTQIQPGGIAEESDKWGYLGLQIVEVHENQKTLDQPPWFADGGDWTFLECEAAREPDVRVLIGTRTRSSDKRKVPVSWGEAMIIVSDAAAGARFVETFAKAFHQTPPPAYGQNPTLRLKMQTAEFGRNLVRDPRGGFKDGSGGSWSATKWFLQDDMGEAEVFFNYSPADKLAEFAEKDEDYREDLVRQLVIALRDGPLPERTPANDPSLTTVGPTVSGWIQVASSNETCRFSRDSRQLAIVSTGPGQVSKLFTASVADPARRAGLAEFNGSIFVHEQITTPQGTVLLVIEQLPGERKVISSSDPQNLWLVDAAGKHQINVPAGVTNWFAPAGCLSPDAHYLALGAWETQPDKKRARVIQLADLKTGQWQKIGLPGTILELVGWTGEKSTGIVLTGMNFRKTDVRHAYLLDPITAQLTPLDAIPREFAPDRKLSPGGKFTMEIIGKERLIISDVNTGQQREFVFHPYDRGNVYPDSVKWLTDQYLVFESTRTSLINTETLKMNYPTAKGSGFDSLEFSPDFQLALGLKPDGHYLGKVALQSGSGN
jgi:hypothetical protein